MGFSCIVQIMCMDISLEGKLGNTVVSTKSNAGVPTKPKAKRTPDASIAITEVIKFLKTYSTAKIVVVIETHCIENGRFVWRGHSPTTYEACSLFEVGPCAIPPVLHLTYA